MKFNILTIFLFSLLIQTTAQNNDFVKWKFTAGDKILSHPIVDGSTIYFGSLDSVFYAVDLKTGLEQWSLKTSYPIHSKAVINNNVVYFKSGNNAYAINKNNGKKIWHYKSNDTTGVGKIDFWDYHSGSPAIYKSLVYFGFANGKLCGLSIDEGKIKHEILRADPAPIKSGLLIDNNTLYLGDWNGKVYAFNLNDGTKLWEYKTYKKQLYETFGQINTQLIVHNNLLIFGSRNPQMQVLNKKNGNVKWSYTEEKGGWISGDPLVLNDTLFIGGSDSHEMFAFDTKSGEKLWAYYFLNNNFSKPLPFDTYLLFTTGDAYNVYGDKNGRGYLYALNRSEGSIKNFAYIGGNIYSGLVAKDGIMYFGSSDNNIYAVDIEKFLNDKTKIKKRGYKAVDIIKTNSKPDDKIVNIKYRMNYKTKITITIKDFQENEIITLYNRKKSKGEHTISWNGENNLGQQVKEGYYFVEIAADEYVQKSVFKK